MSRQAWNQIGVFPLFSRQAGGQAQTKERSMRPMVRPMRTTFRTLLALAFGIGTLIATPVLAQEPPRIVIGLA